MTISQQDLNVYLQLSGIAYSSLAKQFSDDLKFGRKCVTKNREELALLNVYIEILEIYNVESTKNCYTQTELIDLIKKIHKITKINFKSPGFSYIDCTPDQFDGSFSCSFA